MKIILVTGTRPNLMKIAPIIKELNKEKSIEYLLVHTGQHYDTEMNDFFFKDLNIPQPNINLGVGSGSRAFQVSEIMKKFEKILQEEKPDLVLGVGDVNSTLACSLTANMLGIKVAHVEAGLRSYDWTMPEEMNRVITDRVADFLFTTFPSAKENLLKENISEEKIYFVGNVMIDSLLQNKEKIASSTIIDKLHLTKGAFVTITIHRPSNVDTKERLEATIATLNKISEQIQIVFPMHPRTEKSVKAFDLAEKFNKNIKIIKPVGYLDFMKLVMNAKFVLTDSGGIQEETSFLKIPCITVRENTERPETVTKGTNALVGVNQETILAEVQKIMHGGCKNSTLDQLWDGKAAERIIKHLKEEISK